MTTPLPHDAPTVPLPLEHYAQAFDDLFRTHIQRRRFREYLAGLLLPRDRNKTLTALVGVSHHPGADRPGAAAAVLLERGGLERRGGS
jgi:hypothetical protein